MNDFDDITRASKLRRICPAPCNQLQGALDSAWDLTKENPAGLGISVDEDTQLALQPRYMNLLGMFLSLISGSELDLQYLRNYPEIPYQIGRKAGCVMYFCKLRQADYLEISGQF